ncbi:type IV secretory system conjugative DNA transfer family protein [Streptomyces spongiae]|uniref:ATP/GTP-binding protein n=1 Tax=Streptomyces spongiae TaxID=565072 RepID=A0A5N8XLQ8_9ACTN|nr:ATP/GTP-binding protein [Streptomyces spongiae]MPY60184.1 ATP/GTP-binding protein [Streptomyces spongiae]
MDSDGTQDARGTHANPVPRPAGPQERSAVPPRPRQPPGVPPAPEQAPAPSSTTADWLNAARPATRPGIWRYGYRPPTDRKEPERLALVTIAGALIPLLVALVVWSFWVRGALPYQHSVLRLFTPNDWWQPASLWPRRFDDQAVKEPGLHALVVYDGAFFLLLTLALSRLGSWPAILRHVIGRKPQPLRALLSALLALAALSLVFPDSFPGVGWDPLPIVAPLDSLAVLIFNSYDLSALFVYTLHGAVMVLVVWPFARVGGWWPYAKERLGARRAAATPATTKAVRRPRAHWPELRDAGQQEAAELLTAEVAADRMNDVDCARVTRAWAAARRDGGQADFRDTVLRQAGAAWTHPSGARDLPGRTARHDLLAGQVRIGRWVAAERVPLPFHDAGAALGPDVLGTSLLAVGPSGSGKSRTLIEPVTEALTLQALTGRCAVVAVSAAGSPLGSDSAFDVIVRIGDPASIHDLDPYAESEDPDEAAAILAEALVGDLDADGGRSAVTALAQLLGPYRAVHNRFPTLPELRELLEGEPDALTALREALAGDEVMRRELDARIRQAGAPGDPARALADRLALLTRPVFAEFFGGGSAHRAFSLRAVAHHPLRVRIDLPERGHEEAARLITRLVLAQFHAVVREGRRDHFVGLVLDDATGTVTPESVRCIQRLRSQNAGVLLALRSVGDVPEALHGPLYGAVGCRMAFSGVTTWDGSRFAQAWGTEWVETTEVAKHTVFADQPMTRAMHALRKLVTGKAVTTDAVTVRQVERERWSASELAHSVPPGHAVLSLTDVKGEHAPPLLVELGS